MTSLLATLAVAQEPPKPGPPSAPSDPDNKHIQVVRHVVPPQEETELPKLAYESVLVCLSGDSMKRIAANRSEENCDAGGALWNRGGASYWIKNLGDAPGEFVTVTLKDSNSIGQVLAPISERDPINVDPRHFRVVLENEHVRLSRLRLPPRQGTMEGQFLMRLQIPLQPLHAGVSGVNGKMKEVHDAPGSAIWDGGDNMFSIVNLNQQEDLDLLILELKHPFCYGPLNPGIHTANSPPDLGPYVSHIYEVMHKKWLKNIPRTVRDGEKGLVVLNFRVLNDGTIPEDTILVEREFASESLLEKALATVREAGPFPPLPASSTAPYLSLRFSFLFSLPPHPAGCQ